MKHSLVILRTLLVLLVLSYSISIQGQHLTISTSGQTGTSGGSWSSTATANSITITFTGTASIHPSVIEGHLNDGKDVLVQSGTGGSDITISNNITSTTSRNLTFKSVGNITLAARCSTTTVGGSIVFWANSDGGTSNGGVFLDAESRIITTGGHVWIGGSSTNDGSTTWNALTVGNGHATSGMNLTSFQNEGTAIDWDAGVLLDETTINTGGGNIYIAGKRSVSPNSRGGAGVINYSGTNGTLINAGTGIITILGETSMDVAGSDLGIMTGLHPNNYTGRLTIQSANTGSTPAISITASTVTADAGLLVEDHTRILSTATSGGGGISMTVSSGTGSALQVGIGANLGTLDLLSASGAIAVDGGSDAITVPVTVGTFRIGSISGDANVPSSTANVTLTSNTMSLAGSVPIITTGTLTIAPTTGSSFTSTFSTAVLNHTGITGLTIGHTANTAAVTVASTTSIAGPITIYGGDITVNQNLTSTASGADILLKASGNVTTASSRSITTNNGDAIFWADSDNNGNGYILLNDNCTINTANGSISNGLSGGGNIVLAGGHDDGSNDGTAADGIPDGYAASTSFNGVKLSTTSTGHTQFYSGGGNIIVRGKSTLTGGTDVDRIGLYHYGLWTANSGKGAIILEGVSSGFYGINFVHTTNNVTTGNKHLVLISDKASGDAVKITGTSSNSYGIVFNYLNPKEILATGGGNISITGTAGALSGVFMQNQDVLATAGTITVDGGTLGIRTTNYGARFGARAGTGITSSSSNVIISGNVLTFDALTSPFVTNVNTTGTLTVQPSGTSFTSALTWPNSSLSVSGPISGLTLGKTTNTANITISSAQAIAGQITIYGGTITLNQNISSSTGGLISLLGNTVALGFPITLVNGDILLGSSTVVNGTPTNYFKTTGTGTVKRSVANGSSFTYPVGNSSYNPVTITNNTNESDDFSVRVADQVLANGTTGTAITDKVVNRTWHIGKTNANASPGINFTFQWNANEELGTLSDYKLSHFGNSAWALAAGTSGPVSGTTTKTMAHTGYTGTFSPFAIGSTSSVLPVSWLNFTGKKVTQGVELNWSTSSEQNTKDFQVQHSINAQQWTSVGNLPAAGNSNTVRNYRFVHEGPFKNSIQHYYRILQRDLDGKFSYSKVIRIEYLDGATDVVLYPNPASDVLHINITERQELRLVNIQGVVVWKGVLPAGRHEIPVSNFATGNYILQAGKGIYRVVIQ